jgi:TonB family protein
MSRFLSIGVLGSMLAHGAAYAALAGAPRVASSRPLPSSVEFEVAPPSPTPPPPPLTPPPPPPEPLRAAERVSSKVAAAPEPPPVAAPPPAAVDLSGLTLTNDSGEGGWSAPTGDGSTRQAPLGPIGSSGKASHLPEPAAVVPRPAAPVAPSLVASVDLSEKPRPPALDAALRNHYPAEARMRAISGTASLRVRIDADGRVRSAALLSESFQGFGNACRNALVGSSWSAPRDKSGRAVATEVRYTCRFVVD